MTLTVYADRWGIRSENAVKLRFDTVISYVRISYRIIYGNTAQSPPDGFALNLLTYFPPSCTEIP